jgi:hypothetical protein
MNFFRGRAKVQSRQQGKYIRLKKRHKKFNEVHEYHEDFEGCYAIQQLIAKLKK